MDVRPGGALSAKHCSRSDDGEVAAERAVAVTMGLDEDSRGPPESVRADSGCDVEVDVTDNDCGAVLEGAEQDKPADEE